MSKIPLPPNWGKFINSLRYVGYDNYDAIKDLVDNSVDADASEVQVSIEQRKVKDQKKPKFSSKKRKKIKSVTIIDNGRGMTRSQLIEAMKLGSETEYSSGALGKFGMGLITASISMGRRLTVITRCQGSDEINIAVLDLDHVAASGKMECEHKTVSFSNDILKNNLVPISDFGPFSEDGFGTIVEVTKLDQMTNSDATQMANALRGVNHLARTFRFHLEEEDLKILVNGKEVVPCDVLDWNNSLGGTIALTNGWEKGVFDGHEFKYRSTFQYPRTTGQGGGPKERARKGSSGISLLRNRREIDFGKTYGFYANRTNFAGFQIELMLPSALVDKYVGVTFSKNGASKKDEFVHQGFRDFLAEEVINPLRKAAGTIYQKDLTTASFSSLEKEQQTFSERLQKISDILSGLPDRKKKKSTSEPDSQPKTSEKKKRSNSTGKNYGRKDLVFDFVTVTNWPSDEVMLNITEVLLKNGKTKIQIELNGNHMHVVNNYIQAENQDLRNLQLKWFTAIALMLRGMSEDNEAAYSKFFNHMSRNLTSLECTR
tara:strand:- start:206 stop:1837 length:1632 start_codon:yes stop_codon:yes gene_type:complete